MFGSAVKAIMLKLENVYCKTKHPFLLEYHRSLSEAEVEESLHLKRSIFSHLTRAEYGIMKH